MTGRTDLNPRDRYVRKEDWKKIVAITVFDVGASSMMTGLTLTAASTASLLNSFATAAITMLMAAGIYLASEKDRNQ